MTDLLRNFFLLHLLVGKSKVANCLTLSANCILKPAECKYFLTFVLKNFVEICNSCQSLYLYVSMICSCKNPGVSLRNTRYFYSSKLLKGTSRILKFHTFLLNKMMKSTSYKTRVTCIAKK